MIEESAMRHYVGFIEMARHFGIYHRSAREFVISSQNAAFPREVANGDSAAHAYRFDFAPGYRESRQVRGRDRSDTKTMLRTSFHQALGRQAGESLAYRALADRELLAKITDRQPFPWRKATGQQLRAQALISVVSQAEPGC